MVQEQRNNLKKTYIFEPENFKPVAQITDGKTYHYHLDHLGTPRELTDDSGKVVWKVRYKTYGNVAVKEVEEVENNLRFQGQYFDEETGLHYNRFRYYNPNTGQFVTQDPIGLLGGVNNYQYAPNPVGWVDPFGLRCKEITLGDIKFRSIWGGDGIEFYVRDENGGKLSLGLAEVADDKDSVTFGIFNYNYQKEYAKAISEGLPEDQARDRAIRNISFGKHRQNIGYADMKIIHSRDATTVTHDAKGNLLESPLENVPKGVEIREAGLTDRSKLNDTLAKYEDAHKNGREP